MNKKYVYMVYGLMDTECYPVDFSIYDDFKTAYKNFYNRASARGNEFDYELWRMNKNVWKGRQDEICEWNVGDNKPRKIGGKK